MNKLIALLSALTLAFVLVGCANGGSEPSSSNDADTSSAENAQGQTDVPDENSDPAALNLDQEMGAAGVTWKDDPDWVMNASTAGTSFSYMSDSGDDATVCALVDVMPASSQDGIEAVVAREADSKKDNESFISDEWRELSNTSDNGYDYAVYQEDMQFTGEEPTTYYKGYVAKNGICRIVITSDDESIVDAMLATVAID